MQAISVMARVVLVAFLKEACKTAKQQVVLQVGDLVVVDGGMVSLEVKAKMGPDVKVEVVDPGIILSRANLTFKRNGHLLRAKNSMLPVLSSKVSPHHRVL